MDDETDWQRQVLVGLGVLVAVGALIGVIVAFISIKAADFAGIDNGDSSSGSDTATLSAPDDDEPSPDDEPSTPDSSGDEPSTPTPSTQTERPVDKGITLVATPKTVSTYGRINLHGTYEGGAGTTLQVQRMEGGQWVDFPTSATVNGRTFATYIETGRSGPNKFRVKAVGDTAASNPVTVRVS